MGIKSTAAACRQTTDKIVLVKVVVGIELTWAARKKYWLRPKVSEHAAGCGTPAVGSAAAVVRVLRKRDCQRGKP